MNTESIRRGRTRIGATLASALVASALIAGSIVVGAGPANASSTAGATVHAVAQASSDTDLSTRGDHAAGLGDSTARALPADVSLADIAASGSHLAPPSAQTQAVQADSGTAIIAGRVSDSSAGGASVPNFMVYAVDRSFNPIAEGVTDANGFYRVNGLAAGEYTLWARPLDPSTNFKSQWWGHQQFPENATFFSVKAGQLLNPYDFGVTQGGSRVTGNVRTQYGALTADVFVGAYDASDNLIGYDFTSTYGSYEIIGLPESTVKVAFLGSDSSGLGWIWYNNSQTYAGATPIHLSSGSQVGLGDTFLKPISAIAGNVTNVANQPVAGISIYAYDADGMEAQATTDASGNYSMNLAQGSYTVDYYDPNGDYAYQWWQNAATEAEATTVTVGSSPASLNVVLQKSAIVGGTVAVGADHPANIEATLSRSVNGNFVTYYTQNVASDGTFSFTRVAPGTYELSFADTSGFPVTYPLTWQGPDGTNADFVVTAGQTVAADVQMKATGFADISINHTFAEPISWMSVSGLSNGYVVDGVRYYKPTDEVQRQAMAAFLYRFARTSFTPPTTASFADVPVGSPFFTEIEWMKAEGITTGNIDPVSGELVYDPTDPVSRQAMAAFLYRFAHATATAPATPTFTDVSAANPFYAQIEWMASTHLTTGYPNGDGTLSFHPQESVSRQAMAAFLYRYAQQQDAVK
ncbi:carboxypeptidase-like regulatory domain-containing protein [Subtercola endophyticus]|uniref:carboxypeptidase-like regulatory domain-containing protein n=1 Tax=Subtercola endophyticus TaxID=2895559 RepID=UPI001E61FE2C|nr:carboxypeptidase-like regulatory domain-containing protein [Subtercola endophyticus]UFS57731.1 carboxypeptidase regulatory-like domain-containing protein [Subtercola endophyticus]